MDGLNHQVIPPSKVMAPTIIPPKDVRPSSVTPGALLGQGTSKPSNQDDVSVSLIHFPPEEPWSRSWSQPTYTYASDKQVVSLEGGYGEIRNLPLAVAVESSPWIPSLHDWLINNNLMSPTNAAARHGAVTRESKVEIYKMDCDERYE